MPTTEETTDDVGDAAPQAPVIASIEDQLVEWGIPAEAVRNLNTILGGTGIYAADNIPVLHENRRRMLFVDIATENNGTLRSITIVGSPSTDGGPGQQPMDFAYLHGEFMKLSSARPNQAIDFLRNIRPLPPPQAEAKSPNRGKTRHSRNTQTTPVNLLRNIFTLSATLFL